MLDLIAVGDSTLDVFLKINEATVSCLLNKEQCLLCLDFAEKIPVEAVVKVPGAGNASNAAVGGRRLGMKSAIVSVVGNDETGQEIIHHWKKERVDTRYVTVDAKRETNYSTVLNFKGERTILVHHQPRSYSLPALDSPKWIYYTSLGKQHVRLERQLLTYLKKRPDAKLAFNPGTHQLRRGIKALTPVIARSDIFIVNLQEAWRLLEDGERPIQNMLMSFMHLGAKHVVITDGPKGSYATNGKEFWFHPIYPGPVIERTGAGDSYTIGLLYGMWSGADLPKAMSYGSINAWSVVQKIGPQAGLLTRSQMQKTMARFPRVKPRRMTGNAKRYEANGA